MTETVEGLPLPKILYGEIPMAQDRGTGWATLRDLGPVVEGENCFYITRREEILAALRDPEVFSSKTGYDEMISSVPLVPLGFDPPEHTRYRRILHPFFSPQTLGSVLPSLQAQAAEIIELIAQRDGCEVMADLATPYPSQVFLTLFGLPLQDMKRLITWKDAVIELGLVTNPDVTPAVELFTYLTEAVQAQRQSPGDGILSHLLHAEEPLTDSEAIGLSLVFVLAGLDTVTSTIGATIMELARRPELRVSLRENPDQVAPFVEEMIRLEPPAPLLGRVTTRPVTIAGVTLPAGADIRLCIGAMNRDGTDALSGNDLVLDGKVHKHWGFGGGAHRCLGAHLARMELKIVITQWLDRIPEFELAPGFVPEIKWPSATCTLTELPLRFLAHSPAMGTS